MNVLEVAKTVDPTINEADIYQVVRSLRTRSFPDYPIDKLLKELDIQQHDVMNKALRPDKPIYRQVESARNVKQLAGMGKNAVNSPQMELVRVEKTNAIPLALQKLICNKRVSFCLANPAKREYSGLKKGESDKVLEDISFANERVMYENKIGAHDREVARNIFMYTEVAEYIHQEMGSTAVDRYGFSSKFKIKISLYSRENGDKFYPIKDKKGNLICFSREYRVKEGLKLVTYLQCFTDDQIIEFKQVSGYRWEVVDGKDIAKPNHELGKIPIVYGWQRFPEFQDVTDAISRLEVLISNHAEVNDYHAAPKILLTNADKINGFGEKGSNSMIITAKEGAKMEYITWEHSTESVKAEIDRLLEFIWTITQTPNINFDNLKNMGQVSGVSIKLLFMDAHLAVKDKEGVLLDYFQRRNSITTTMLAMINSPFKSIVDRLEVKSSLDPFMIADEKEKAEIAQIQNGGQATKSQYTTVIDAGGDQEEYDQILKEENERKIVDITEPTI